MCKDEQEIIALMKRLDRWAFWEDIVFGIGVACFAILIIWGFV